MRKIVTHSISLACGIAIAMSFNAASWISPGNIWLRENGVDWFHFGPAIIPSCQCLRLDVTFGSFANRISTTDPIKIAAIKQWIIANQFDLRFRNSPTIPIDADRDMLPDHAIYLFSSPDPNKTNSLIMIIPINPLTMGVDQKICDAKIAELKKLTESSAP